MGTLFRGTLGKLILVAVGLGVFYLISAYVEGIQYQMSGFAGDFEQVVNRNLLAPWQPPEKFFTSGNKWCAPGTGPDWPKTRRQCSFVGGAVAGCSILTYGRSCAVIGVPKIYFDDPDFREALRIALSNLCAVFDAHDRAWYASIYYTLGCGGGRPASLSVYIDVRDIKVEPPYDIPIPPQAARLVAVAYFSAWTKQITTVSEYPE